MQNAECRVQNYSRGKVRGCLCTRRKAIRLTDGQARAIIKLCSGCGNVTEFQALPKAEQEKNIEEFKNRGLSIRQMVRLTGVSKGLVEKWLK